MAVPDSLYAAAQKDHSKGIYCPLGHTFVFTGDTELQRERAARKRAEDRLASERSRADQTEASLRATKGVVTKMRKRAIAGACQFCHRTFVNVAAHVATKHPDEQS